MVHEQEHSAQQVSAAFVSQYYNTLLKNTDNLFRFYKEDSTVSHAEFNESGNMITGLKVCCRTEASGIPCACLQAVHSFNYLFFRSR